MITIVNMISKDKKMKTKNISIRHKNKPVNFGYVEFESLVEALDHATEADIIRIYNFGAREISKQLAIGRDPFRRKRRVIKLNTLNLNEEQMNALLRVGLLPEE